MRRSRGLAALGLLLLFAGAAARAQSLALAGIAHAAFRVHDVQASRSFYERLGYEAAFEFDRNGAPSQVFLKINDRQFLELYAQEKSTQAIGLMHLCYFADDLNALHDAYVAKGLHPISVRKAAAGNLLFTLAGPEGENIEFTQYLPGSRHMNDVGKHLGADRPADQLLGAALQVTGLAAARTFYTNELGFAAEHLHGQEWLALPGGASEGIVLKAGGPAQLFFAVKSVRQAAKTLQRRGLKTMRGRKSVSVTDPDGNVLVFAH